jgi:hypothetical protein
VNVLVLANVAGLIWVVELCEELLLLGKVIVRVVDQALQERRDLLPSLVLLLRPAGRNEQRGAVRGALNTEETRRYATCHGNVATYPMIAKRMLMYSTRRW